MLSKLETKQKQVALSKSLDKRIIFSFIADERADTHLNSDVNGCEICV